jgi:hypothetical protein
MNRRVLFFLSTLVLPILACADFTVVNTSATPVWVHVSLPDGGESYYGLSGNGEHSWTAKRGGTYRVLLFAPSAYYARLLSMRDELEAATKQNADDPLKVSAAVGRLLTIQSELREESSFASCSGSIPSDTPDGILVPGSAAGIIVAVEVRQDPATNGWSCQETDAGAP